LIKIKVRYLGAIREMAGTSEEEILLNDSSTLGQLIDYLVRIHPNLNLSLTEGNFMAVINGRIVTDYRHSLKDLDEVVLSHIVAGGR